ncbi:PqqD family protein [Halobacillus trueperi]|uniref:PqqD family protein n=1 Tax=Halobacillus trueperi TaxID=156205 RepID=A0A3E0J4S0_9BACI|nr:PqqD family protein [Halobacillus trueperi]REJ07943.1 PqqD family protein [Halobacillus trueperi]
MIEKTLILEKNNEQKSRKYLKSTIIEPAGITLNELASDVYNNIDGKNTLEEICQRITSEYNVEMDECINDVTGLVKELIELEAIKVK